MTTLEIRGQREFAVRRVSLGLASLVANHARLQHRCGAATAARLPEAAALAAAGSVASEDLASVLVSHRRRQRERLRAAGVSSFADGFSAASLLAAGGGLIAAILTFSLVGAEDTAPSRAEKERPCKLVDCRDPP